jgi:hypothetical protein
MKHFLILSLFLLITSCAYTTDSDEVKTPLSYPLVGTISHEFTKTPIPSPTETSKATPAPTGSPTLILTPTLTPVLTPTLYCDPNFVVVEFPTDLITGQNLHPSKISSYIVSTIPPLPDNVEQVFSLGLPYGEVPWYWPYYTIFLMRQEDTLMLWLGLPLAEGDCCGRPSYLIYDAIPMPPLESDEVLIPFFCSRDEKIDLYLIGITSRPVYELTDDVRHAWRINPETTSLDEVSTRGMECGCWW